MDLSPLRKFEVLGPDAEALLQATVTRDVRAARGRPGRLHGDVQRDGRDARRRDRVPARARDNFRWVGGSEYGGVWLREQAERLGLRVWVKESTDDLHNVAVQGPLSREILSEIVWTSPAQTPFAELRWFRFSVARLDGPTGIPIIASRTGYSGELGYELFCHPKDAPALWDRVLEAGAPHGLTPLGLEALDMLRIEAGLIFAGYEFDDQVDPFEAGIGFTVPEDKEDDFVGTEALAERRAHPQRTPRRARARGERDRRARRLRPRRPLAGRRGHVGHALARAQEEHRALPHGRFSTPSSGPRSRSASSTATRSGSRRPSSASRSTTPTRRGRARDGDGRVPHARAGRVVRPRRLPDRRGGPHLRPCARAPARALRASLRRRLRDRASRPTR